MGNGSVIHRREIQRLSAGTGVRHSEYNHSKTDPVRFLQIWLYPDRTGVAPGYEQREFPEAARRGALCLVVSPDGRDGSLSINQDVQVFAALLEAGEEVRHHFDTARHGWLQVVRGDVELNGGAISEGDGVAISQEPTIRIAATSAAELLLFDLA
jgi:redox-sensitive bicupin YhaK (pirin superfamily)